MFSNGKEIDLLNVFEFVPGQTYYIDIGDNGYHSSLNETDGLQILEKVQTPALFDKRAEKRASEILIKFNFNNSENQAINVSPKPIEHVVEDPVNLKIPQYTPIKLSFVDDVSSNNYKSNDIIEFQVVEDVIVNNKICISKGTLVKGQLIKSIPSQKCGYPAFMDIVISKIEISEDDSVSIIGHVIKSGVSKISKVRKIRVISLLAIMWGPVQEFSTIFLEVFLWDSFTSQIKGGSLLYQEEKNSLHGPGITHLKVRYRLLTY